MEPEVYFFGCWNRPGHFWFAPSGQHMTLTRERAIPFDEWIDGGWAPRFFERDHGLKRYVADPTCCFVMEVESYEHRRLINYATHEHDQGKFILHHKQGWSLMSWWDRAQGDTRGACNSNLVVNATLTSDVMFSLLCEHFPTVANNIAKAGIVLRELAVRAHE